jgi:hypothetical protein
MTKNELRDELIEAIKRVYEMINPYDPFDTAYEASHVANYLGSSIIGLTDHDEFSDDDDVEAELVIELRATFPNEIEAYEKATAKWVEGGIAAWSDRKDHQYAIDLLDIIDALK